MSIFSKFTKTFQKPQKKASAPKSGGDVPTDKKSKSKKPAQKQIDPQILSFLTSAKSRSEEILQQAKKEAQLVAEQSKEELEELRSQYQEIKSEFEKKQKSITIQEAIVHKKEFTVKKLTDLLRDTQSKIEDAENEFISKLINKVDIDEKDARDLIMSQFQQTVETESQKELMYAEEEEKEQAETKAQEVLVQVMKHGSTSYVSDYTPPIVTFESAEEEAKILGQNEENLRLIEQLTTAEITFDPELHQLKLYCFNTIKREVARVLLERLKKVPVVNAQKIKQLLQIVEKDLNKQMFEEGKYLCHQLRIYNLPTEIIQTLGMFKFRYSYGQNMIIHTLEEAKIGIALAHELGADSNVVRLGCLFHDIGKVLYEESSNHVEAGVIYLRRHNIPESVVACVAESHEDIPFSSIESMIVHVADSISGARPGARFDDYEGFLKHQQGLIDISTGHAGVTEAFVINGGREVRVMVDPHTVKDDDLDRLATSIRDQVQEFSTYPGSIVVNVVREFQHSELKD